MLSSSRANIMSSNIIAPTLLTRWTCNVNVPREKERAAHTSGKYYLDFCRRGLWLCWHKWERERAREWEIDRTERIGEDLFESQCAMLHSYILQLKLNPASLRTVMSFGVSSRGRCFDYGQWKWPWLRFYLSVDWTGGVMCSYWVERRKWGVSSNINPLPYTGKTL